MTTYIIAEAGVAAGGSIKVAEKMIKAAKTAGASCIKWQAFIPKLTAQGNKELEDILLHTYFGRDELDRLKGFCMSREIDFLCSAFELENLDWLVDIGERRVKIPSCRNTDRKFLQSACKKFDEVIISTGMMTEGGIHDLWFAGAFDKNKIKLLHCVSAYPCPFEQVNLAVLNNALCASNVKYSGLSDHTVGWEVSVAAVALGAQIIEKHFTLKRINKPDDCVSLEPDEFADMVRRIRNVELAMGDGIKRIMDCEKGLLWRKNQR